MPGVDVYHGSRFYLSDGIATAIKRSVRKFGCAHFSVPERQLDEPDFSFKFHQRSSFDELTNDFIVRIRLHNFSDRREALDEKAADLVTCIADNLAVILRYTRFTVGVEIMRVEIDWGAAKSS